MIEVRGKSIVANTKAKVEPFREQIAGREIAIFQFEYPTEAQTVTIPRSQFLAARFSTDSKVKTFQALDCKVSSQLLQWSPEPEAFNALLSEKASNRKVAGIIVQTPIPQELKPSLKLLPFEKDIDGWKRNIFTASR